MTKEQVRAVLLGTVAEETTDSLVLTTTSGNAGCSFHEGRLYRVDFSPPAGPDQYATYQAVTRVLSERYGSGFSSTAPGAVGFPVEEVRWADEEMTIVAQYTHFPPHMAGRMMLVGVRYESRALAAAIHAQEEEAQQQREAAAQQRRQQQVQGGL